MAIDYSALDRDALIDLVKKLDTTKKYGLVWEADRTREIFENDLHSSIPFLTEVKKKHILIDDALPNNLFIEGDNYHALSVLNYTHQGKIDVIYIDPPYNTGNKSWKYNNDYVEKDDNFKHSKWLSFMSKRLLLAKKLLTQSGVIVVAIDDYEIHTLRLLMDEIFGEQNRMGTITVVHNPRGRNDEKFFATSHEYLLVYALDQEFATLGHFKLTEEDIDSYSKSDGISAFSETPFIRTGNNSTRESRPNLYYPIYFNEKTGALSLKKSAGDVELLPVNEAGEEKTWRWGKETFEAKKDTELTCRVVKGTPRLFKKRRVIDSKGKKPKTVWSEPRYDASAHGIMVLQKLFGEKDVFPYPKSLYAVKDILELITTPTSTVLDFFAGSGTTGHAVSLLNKDDGGSRKFILCTDNENNIAVDVCYPRTKKVIEGVDTAPDITGIASNLYYYQTSFIKKSPSIDETKIQLAEKCNELIKIREGVFHTVKETDDFFLMAQNDRYVGVYFSIDPSNLKKLKVELDKVSGQKTVYVFTLDSFGVNMDDFDDWSGIEILPIPQSILEIFEGVSNV
jgi:adenine-specific DNA-methyltransferase